MATTRSGTRLGGARYESGRVSTKIGKSAKYTISKKKKAPAPNRKQFCSSEGRNVQGRKKGAQLYQCKKGK